MEKNNYQYFRPDEYKCYRLGLIQAGFFWGIILINMILYNATLAWGDLWGVVLLFIAPFMIVLYRKLTYVAIVDDQIKIRDGFEDRIYPNDLKSVSYQTRPTSIAMVLKYQKGDKEITKSLAADWFNTDSLVRMNNALKQLNPNLEIFIDDGAKKGMEKRKNLHLKTPISVFGWVTFSFIWFTVGFAIISGILISIHLLKL